MIITYGLIHVINLAWNVKDLYGKNAIIFACNKEDGTAKNVFIVKMEDVRYIKECIKMKIWEAELNLFDEDFGKGEAYKINFSFEFNGEDYKLNESQTEYLNVYGMFYDPTYVLVIIAAVIALAASGYCTSVMNRYSRMRISSGVTGRQAAEMVLHSAGIHDVTIWKMTGMGSSFYR